MNHHAESCPHRRGDAHRHHDLFDRLHAAVTVWLRDATGAFDGRDYSHVRSGLSVAVATIVDRGKDPASGQRAFAVGAVDGHRRGTERLH